jgi:hypothetical protein
MGCSIDALQSPLRKPYRTERVRGLLLRRIRNSVSFEYRDAVRSQSTMTPGAPGAPGALAA